MGHPMALDEAITTFPQVKALGTGRRLASNPPCGSGLVWATVL